MATDSTANHTMEPVSVRAPAKINLFLHVTGKRADGYHEIASLAVFTSFGDTVAISPALAGDGIFAVAIAIAMQTASGRSAWNLLKEGRGEIRKVVWPTQQETTQTTLIVVVAVFLVGL